MMVTSKRINPEDEPDGRKHETVDETVDKGNRNNRLISIRRNLQDQLRFKDIYENAIARLRFEIRYDPNNSHKKAELANARLFLEESKVNISALEFEASHLTSQSMADFEAELRQECASVSQQTGISAQEVITKIK